MILPVLAGLARAFALAGRAVFAAVRSTGAVVSRGALRAGRGAAQFGRSTVRKVFKGGKKPVKRKSIKRPTKKGGKRRKSKKVSLLEEQWKEFKKYRAEMKKRSTAVQHKVLRQVAEHIREDVYSRIPQEYKELKKQLQVGVHASSSGPIYVVHAPFKQKNVTRKKNANVVLYVEAKSSSYLKPAPKEVRLLEQYSPWTVDTLPFRPDPKSSTVIERRVSAKEFQKTKSLRKRDARRWRPKLAALGVKTDEKLDLKKFKVVSDIAYDSMQLEFGVGKRYRAHWRPAILWATRGGAKKLFEASDVQRALFDPSYKGWKRWKAKGKSVNSRQMKQYEAFQKKLGIGS